MPFLLSVDHQLNGTTHLQYDAGPARRIQVVTLTENAHIVTAIPANDLLGYSLSRERPPVERRKQV